MKWIAGYDEYRGRRTICIYNTESGKYLVSTNKDVGYWLLFCDIMDIKILKEL